MQRIVDETKCKQIIAVLVIGGSRTLAAKVVGCHLRTIYNEAQADQDFAERLNQAETFPEQEKDRFTIEFNGPKCAFNRPKCVALTEVGYKSLVTNSDSSRHSGHPSGRDVAGAINRREIARYFPPESHFGDGEICGEIERERLRRRHTACACYVAGIVLTPSALSQ